MVNIKDIARLKKLTGLGASKCSEALKKANGELDEAIKLLREEGRKIAYKRAGRTIEAGRIFAGCSDEKNFGVLFTIDCETDFVAKTQGFKTLGETILEIALNNLIPTKEDLLIQACGTHTIAEEITQLSGRVGENVSLANYETVQGHVIGFYLHTGSKKGAIAVLNKADNHQVDLQDLARSVAMQIVISNPVAIDENSIESSLLESEKRVALAQLTDAQRANLSLLDRIIKGKMASFIKENTLLHQPFIKDDQHTVGAYLQKIAPNLSVVDYKHLQIGD